MTYNEMSSHLEALEHLWVGGCPRQVRTERFLGFQPNNNNTTIMAY